MHQRACQRKSANEKGYTILDRVEILNAIRVQIDISVEDNAKDLQKN
jgi:hypothetical protein